MNLNENESTTNEFVDETQINEDRKIFQKETLYIQDIGKSSNPKKTGCCKPDFK